MITAYRFVPKGDSTLFLFRGPEEAGRAMKMRFARLRPSKPFEDRFQGYDYGVFLRTTDPSDLAEIEEWVQAGCPAGADPRAGDPRPDTEPIVIGRAAAVPAEAPAVRELELYIAIEGESYGPVSLAEAVRWAEEGRFGENDWVYLQGSTDWAPAASIPELEEVFRRRTVTFRPAAPAAESGRHAAVLSLFRSEAPLGPVRGYLYLVQPAAEAPRLEQISPVSLLAKTAFELQRLNGWTPVDRFQVVPNLLLVSLEPLARLDVTRHPVRVLPQGETVLTLEGHRVVLLRLLSHCIKWRLHLRHRFQFGLYNEMQDPAPVFCEEGVEVKRVYPFSLLNDAEGRIVLQMDQRMNIRSLRSVADLLAAGEEVEGLAVQRAYTLGTGYLTGVSTRTISDYFDEIGDTPLSFYADVIAEFLPEPPDPATPAVFISYRKFSRGQDLPAVPQLLHPVLSLEEVRHRHPNLSKTIFHILKSPVADRLLACAEVVRKANPIELAALTFSPEPIRVGEGGVPGFRLEPPEAKANFVFGGGAAGRWVRSGLRRHSYYRKPEAIRLGYLYPKDREEDLAHLKRSLRAVLEGTHGIRIEDVEARWYEPGADNTLRYKVAANTCQRKGVDLVVAVVTEGAESAYGSFKNFLLEHRIPSQMVLVENVRRDEIYENLALGVVAKAGGQPWVLKEMPGPADAFVGIDVSRWKGKVAAAAHICDRSGEDIGWNVSYLVRGEKIPDETIVQMVESLLFKYQERHGAFPAHVVFHRDGFFRENLDLLEGLCREIGATADCVEIKKTGAARVAWVAPDGSWKNPPKGTVVVVDDRLAYLCTTGVSEEGKDDFWAGVPKPLAVVRLRGTTDILTLARQIFWLSEMHVGSLIAVRLPITTYYADVTAGFAMTGLLPVGIVQDRPYCI